MNAISGIEVALKSALCASLDVSPVPIGYSISTGFYMPDGDLLSFYLVADETGTYHLEDDGTTLPNAIAAGLDLKSPVREGLLRGMLSEEGARYDDDLAIRSDDIDEERLGAAALRFISALIRTRDLALIGRENVAASFADDIRRDLERRLPAGLMIDSDRRPTDANSPDLTLRDIDTGLKAARIYAAGADLRLMDALVDFQARGPGDSPVIAVVDRRRSRVSEKRFNTATNRGLPMAVVDGGGTEWIGRVLEFARSSDGITHYDKNYGIF